MTDKRITSITKGKKVMKEIEEKETRKLTKMKKLERREIQEKINNVVIKGLEKKTKKMEKVAKDLLKKEFGTIDKLEIIGTVGRERREITMIELED